MKRSEIVEAAKMVNGSGYLECPSLVAAFQAGAEWALEQVLKDVNAVTQTEWHNGAFDVVKRILTVEDDHD